MTRFRGVLFGLGLALAVGLGLGPANKPAQAQEEKGEAGVEVLTRGPIHEAFGKPVVFDAKPGLDVPKAPPEAIEEMPPDQKPEGDNVAWIPGYWGWMEDRNDFVWVSGIWRVLPPGREWVPGYWQKTSEGYQWVSGFWGSVEKEAVEYLPPPPDSLENGPSTEAPSVEHLWAPGTWVWHDTRYVWRPGSWAVARPGWIWVPAHYTWTPGGCVFVEGYWDYSFRRRGIIFAPVYFDRVVYTRPAYYYSPSVVIDVDIVTDHFFCRPRYHHYYFGDYYASSYVDVGIVPWFSFQLSYGRYRYYDPVFTHYHWHYHRHGGGDWFGRVREDYRYRVATERARPPRTLAAQQAIVRGSGNQVNQNQIIAKNFTQVVNNTTIINNTTINNVNQPTTITKFEKIDKQQQKAIAAKAKDVQQFKEKRRELEVKTGAETGLILDKPAKPGEAVKPSKPAAAVKPVKVQLPKATIAARPIQETPKEKAPPPPPTVSRPDPTARPRPVITEKPGKPEPKATAKPTEPKPVPKAEAKPEKPKVDLKPAPKSEPKAEPKPEPKPEPRKAEPKPEPRKAEPKPAPKPEAKPERPRVDPKPESKPDRKPETKAPAVERREPPPVERKSPPAIERREPPPVERKAPAKSPPADRTKDKEKDKK